MAQDTSTSTNINIKTSTLVTGLAILIIGILGWSLKGNYDSIQRQLTKQWEKIDAIEK
jgi:hypothetical protein